jgi:mRNA interferase RelE/StbE
VASYSVIIKRSAAKEIEDLPKKERAAVVAKIRALAEDPRPRGCDKLAGDDKYRIRHGVYRILYEVNDDAIVVTVVRVRHRREAYR